MRQFIIAVFMGGVLCLCGLVRAQTETGFSLSPASSLEKVRLEKVYNRERTPAETITLSAARQESESFQLVIIPEAATLEGVLVHVSELSGPSSIPLRWHIVDYVRTGEPCYPTEYVGWWPDPLLAPGPFTVPADSVGVLWIGVDVPPRAPAGLYKGTVTVNAADVEKQVAVELRVRDFTLPMPGTLAAPFGLYAPILARYPYGDVPYEDRMPIEKFAQWCEFMGRYRLTPKNIGYEYVERYVNGKPLPQVGADAAKYISGTPEPGVETKKTLHYHQSLAAAQIEPVEITDTFRVDMTALHKTVGILSPRYYPPYSLGLYRLPTAPFFMEGLIRKDPEAVARPFRAHAEEWKRQHLPMDVFVYGVDEPKDELLAFLRETYLAVKRDYPSVKIMQTISHKNPQTLVGAADIWCPLTPSLASDFYQKRRAAGDSLWTYVCVSPRDGRHANFFIDEPAVDHRVLFWQCRQYNCTGFLYWAVCWWEGFPSPADSEFTFPEIPIRMENHIMYKRTQVNGDGFLMYPDGDFNPLPSVRLEVIRDGIEDYEYLALLEELVGRCRARQLQLNLDDQTLRRAEELMHVPAEISASITEFTQNPDSILSRREAVGEMIERLNTALNGE